MIKRVPRRYGAPRQCALGVVGDPQESAGSEEPDGKGDEALGLEGGTDPKQQYIVGLCKCKTRAIIVKTTKDGIVPHEHTRTY